MADLTARARAHPGTLLYNATAGALPYLFSGFLKSANLDMLLVPYREYNLAAQDLGDASNQSEQRNRPTFRGSILDADPPAQGVKIARRMTTIGRRATKIKAAN
jgi:hypothetical protein